MVDENPNRPDAENNTDVPEEKRPEQEPRTTSEGDDRALRDFAQGKPLDSIQIEIEGAGTTGRTPPRGGQGESDGPGNKPETGGETPRKKAARFEPAVYDLDLSMADEVKDRSGHIDWSRAMTSRSLSATPPKEESRTSKATPAPSPKEATEEPVRSMPSQPASPVDVVESWTHLPGAEKVLRADSGVPKSKPVAVQPAKESTEENGEKPMSRYEQLKRRPSFQMDPQAVKTANEFSDILFHVNRAASLLSHFRQSYPYLIAPNIFGVWEDNLKETTTTMLREFQNMRDPRKKQYDRKYVCQVCKSVFFVSLPEGMCDECRGKRSTQAPY